MSDPNLPNVPSSDAPAEPLLTVGTITTVGAAIVALIVSFGVHVNNNQQSAILGVLVVLAPIVVAVWGRSKVFAPKTVRQMVNRSTAAKAGKLPTTTTTDIKDV